MELSPRGEMRESVRRFHGCVRKSDFFLIREIHQTPLSKGTYPAIQSCAIVPNMTFYFIEITIKEARTDFHDHVTQEFRGVTPRREAADCSVMGLRVGCCVCLVSF
mgnify:CR=1 FL=1